MDFGTLWWTADIFCQRCHKSTKGIAFRNLAMTQADISLDLCAPCIADIADETKHFR